MNDTKSILSIQNSQSLLSSDYDSIDWVAFNFNQLINELI